MENKATKINISELKIKGKLSTDWLYRAIYATDASSYRQIPKAVAIPENENDIIEIIKFCTKNHVSLIPRGAGTSLAGQVVGSGIVVDVSQKMNKILEINPKEKWCIVQPGVILSQLNRELLPYGLFFGPETSTANRVAIGGMLGNNACGLHSLVYGSLRDHLISVKCVLSDCSIVEFSEISDEQFQKKLNLSNLEGQIYRKFNEILQNNQNVQHILQSYPPPSLKRRNTGYALDLVANTEVFCQSTNKLNLAKIIAGSEGTLAFATEIKLNLVELPPKEKALVCVHFKRLYDAFYANLIALEFKPVAVELMDKTILELTKDNLNQQKNRFFLQGDPAAILIVEFAQNSKEEIQHKASQMQQKMQQNGYGYAFPIVWGAEITKVWDLRRSGLGVLSNVHGDARPVSLVEDTAVDVNVLPEYVKEFDQIMQKYGLSAVYHAHIGTGELHLRPILNLKNSKDVQLSRKVATEIAMLIRKYNGSLSGEHGDGRLRSEFIPLIYGQQIYQWFRQIKYTFDPQNIFNPHKIVDPEPMDTSLRYKIDEHQPLIETYFDFSHTQGFLRAAEKCNGSADCRKSYKDSGAMCPSYQALKDEYFTTRARANALREFFTYGLKPNKFSYQQLYDILSYCLSCKACKSECPSNVDIAKLKAEFLQHYYKSKHIPLRAWLIANFPVFNSLMSIFPKISNALIDTNFAKFFSNLVGFQTTRNIPLVHRPLVKQYKPQNSDTYKQKVYFFADEFTNLNDTHIGIKAIMLLEKLGYKVIVPKLQYSGRTYLSKGLVKKAKKLINRNVEILKHLISEQNPLIGIEPSAILTMRDEALDLADDKQAALKISQNTLLIEEFLYNQMQKGIITSQMFTQKPCNIRFHVHCYQKALSQSKYTLELLNLPQNYLATEIPSGCCGMAGAFGYEKEHYEISQKVGELVLFPTIRTMSDDTIVAANGTSCRHQIWEGTNVKAYHPVEILLEAMEKY